jgi:CobQ-like glutamine amidotransferase family enzyme
MTPHLHIGHLYPLRMNTYGDSGNIICLRQRCRWRDIEVTVHALEIDSPLPPVIDLYFFGGGQDAAQASLGRDLHTAKAERLLADTARGIPLLSICGGYQLLGRFYAPFDADPIPGLGLFPVETRASHTRMIGDVVIEANHNLIFPDLPGNTRRTLVGFENHSGKTSIVDTSMAAPLGTVVKGYGNNGFDRSEGCIIHHAIGCYLHGSFLPKNPHMADWLIEKALQIRFPEYSLGSLDDREEWATHSYIVGRYT